MFGRCVRTRWECETAGDRTCDDHCDERRNDDYSFRHVLSLLFVGEWIGGDRAFQLCPDMRGIAPRRRGHYDAAPRRGHDEAGDLLEVVMTNLGHVVVDDTRPE